MAARIGEEVRFGERLTRSRELARSALTSGPGILWVVIWIVISVVVIAVGLRMYANVKAVPSTDSVFID